MKNADKPINPSENFNTNKGDKFYFLGLTKREYACIKLGIPESGDEEIDDLIKKSERKIIAGLVMQGMIANTDTYVQDKSVIAKLSIEHADELLKQLENENI